MKGVINVARNNGCLAVSSLCKIGEVKDRILTRKSTSGLNVEITSAAGADNFDRNAAQLCPFDQIFCVKAVLSTIPIASIELRVKVQNSTCEGSAL